LKWVKKVKRASNTVMIVAAEPSADLHGSRLVAEIRQRRPDLSFFGIGGPEMQQAGVRLICRMEELAVIGFTEILGRLPVLRKAFFQSVSLLKQTRPALLILIDYPGFNMILAKRANALGIPVMYYIAPQVWAWWRSRARQIARWVSKVVAVFPFEVPFFAQYGVDVEFVGHPLLDVVKSRLSKTEFCNRWGLSSGFPLLALLPGSRSQEIKRLFPVMLETARILKRELAGLQVAVSRVEAVDISLYRQTPNERDLELRIVEGRPYEMMAHADLLLVASGTATLEAAILGAPMIILYKVAPLTYLIGKALARVSNIGLVNIVGGKQIVPEFVQAEARPERIAAEALEILKHKDRNRIMRQQLAEVKERLGPKGATQRAAQIAVRMLEEARRHGNATN